MGASVAHLVGKLFNRNWPDCRVLLAAGAGAGHAATFNAPIAGSLFVLEELVRKFEPRIAFVALGASSSAIVVASFMIGDMPDFQVPTLVDPSSSIQPLFFVLGVFVGLAAIAYNRAILGAIATAAKLLRWPVELRALVIGAAVGPLAWAAPDMVRGGDLLTQRALLGGGDSV
jgi:CIC family chloride channel protein